MATQATQIVTLAELKTEGRIASTDDDALLTTQLSAAVSAVESALGRPLLRRAFVTRVPPPPTRSSPLILYRPDLIQTGISVAYYEPGQLEREAPGGTLTASQLAIREHGVHLWEISPNDDWPEYEYRFPFRISGNQEMASPIPDAIRQAVRVTALSMFDGFEYETAMRCLTAPHAATSY